MTKPSSESIERLQLDALKMALCAFGPPEDAPAATMNLGRGSKTGLTKLNVHEDGVIQHDACIVPGYESVDSEVGWRVQEGRKKSMPNESVIH